MAALKQLVSIEGIAKVLVALPTFLPDLAASTGRAIMLPGVSWLGPAFVVSVLPDQGVAAQPSVIEQCFAGVSTGARRMVRGAARRSVSQLLAACKAVAPPAAIRWPQHAAAHVFRSSLPPTRLLLLPG